MYTRSDSKYWYCEFEASDGISHRKSTGVRKGEVGAEKRAGKAAQEKLDAHNAKLSAARSVVPSVSLETAIERYLTERAPDSLGQKTFVLYRGKLADVSAAMPHARLADIDEDWIKDYVIMRKGVVDEHKRRAVSDVSIRKEWIALAATMRFAIKNKLVGAPKMSPFDNVSKKADCDLSDSLVKERGLNIQQLEHLESFVRANGDPLWIDLFEILVEGGFRLGEVLNLTWDLVDLRAKFVHLITSKTNRGRDVPISKVMAAMFDRRRTPDNPTYVFTNPATGKPYVTMFRGWDRIRKAAGMSHVRLHDLRHTFAKLTADAGVSESDRMLIQGHSTEAMARRYRGNPDRIARSLNGKTPLAKKRKPNIK